MPLYEYTCEKCHSPFELLIRGNEQPKCPSCGSAKLEKHFSVPAAHVRGSSSLPVCSPAPMQGGCGLPQCGMGGCMNGGL